MTKQEAIALFGKRPIDLARALNLSKQAIHSWSDPLTDMQRDRVQAELWRRHERGEIVPGAQPEAESGAAQSGAAESVLTQVV